MALTDAGSIVWKTALALNKPSAIVIILFFRANKGTSKNPRRA